MAVAVRVIGALLGLAFSTFAGFIVPSELRTLQSIVDSKEYRGLQVPLVSQYVIRCLLWSTPAWGILSLLFACIPQVDTLTGGVMLALIVNPTITGLLILGSTRWYLRTLPQRIQDASKAAGITVLLPDGRQARVGRLDYTLLTPATGKVTASAMSVPVMMPDGRHVAVPRLDYV